MICETCGVKRTRDVEITVCPICADERQYIPVGDQKWTSLEDVSVKRNFLVIERQADLFEIRVTPEFGIGQRMFFVKTKQGGYLWDCVPLVDQDIANFFRAHGGVRGMAISHPHFYSSMKNWAELLSIPVYTHKNDAVWLGEQFDTLVKWSGRELELADDIKVFCAGGHFEGSCVMHVASAQAPYLLSSDTIAPNVDRKTVSFMRSFPNRVPLGLAKLDGIQTAMNGLSFEKIFGAFPGAEVLSDGREAFDFSMARYKSSIGE